MAASIITNSKCFSRSLPKLLSQSSNKILRQNVSTQSLYRTISNARLLSCAKLEKISSSALTTSGKYGRNIRQFHVTSVVSDDIKEIKTPPFADSITEGDIIYQKEVGDAVATDECVCEIETEKTSIPVLSPVAGAITELCFSSGDTVQANMVLFKVKVGAAGAAPAAKAEEPKPAAPAAPAPAAPTPSAPPKQEPASPSAGAIPSKPPPAPAVPKAPMSSTPTSSVRPTPGGRTESRVKMTRMRQTISRRLKEAQNTCAMLTTFNEIDMSNVKQLRDQYKDAFMKRHNMKLGFMSAFVKASAYALQDMPAVNGVIDGDEIVYRDYVDISVAVATPKGLVMPVLRNAEGMNFADIERELGELALKARNNQIAIEDMSGGTFSISNGGVYGSMFGTPIINPPQSAILGMHGMFDRPVAINGKVEIRPMMYVALTYDHRLIDGREGVTFLKKIKSAVEDPRVMFLDL